jgi:hypothetical protein
MRDKEHFTKGALRIKCYLAHPLLPSGQDSDLSGLKAFVCMLEKDGMNTHSSSKETVYQSRGVS